MKAIILIVVALNYFSLSGSAQNDKFQVVVDTTITGFRFAMHDNETKFYTKNGFSDILSAIKLSNFSVKVSNKISFDQAKAEILKRAILGWRYIFTERREKDTILNGQQVYYISYKQTIEGEKFYANFVFSAVSNTNPVVVFTSEDLDMGKYTEKFKKTFYTLMLSQR